MIKNLASVHEPHRIYVAVSSPAARQSKTLSIWVKHGSRDNFPWTFALYKFHFSRSKELGYLFTGEVTACLLKAINGKGREVIRARGSIFPLPLISNGGN